MGEYWERGTRSDWAMAKRKKQRTAQDAEIARKAFAEINAILADGQIEPEPEPAPPCEHEFEEDPHHLHTLRCKICRIMVENPKKFHVEQSRDSE